MAASVAFRISRIDVGRRRRIRRDGGGSGEKRIARVAADADDLLVRTGGADRDAFSRLYDEVAPMVYGIALRVVRDPARAEEISQEAFLQIWDRAGRFDPERGSARAWIAAIAHRRAVDAVRSEQASRDRTLAVGSRSVAAAFDATADEVVASDEHRRIREALHVLTEPQRQVIELAYFAGLTYRQVAERLGTPLGTVKTRMRSALLTLADILERGHA